MKELLRRVSRWKRVDHSLVGLLIMVILSGWCGQSSAGQLDPETVKRVAQIKAAGIRRIKTYIYPKVDGKPTKKPQIKQEEIFNPEGLVVEEINYNDDGTLMSSWKYTYDGPNQIGSQFFWGTTLKSEKTRKFDEQGRVIEETEHDRESGTRKVKRFSFNAAGKKVEEQDVEKNERNTWAFDSEGREIEASYRVGDGPKKIIAKKLYDTAGNLSEIQYPLADGYSCRKFKYDERGNEIEFRDQDMDGSVEIKQSRYDGKNRLIEVIRFPEGEGEDERIRQTWAYDDSDRVTSWSSFKGKSRRWRIDYRFDEQGRPVEETSYDAADLVEATTTQKYGVHGLLEEERVTDAAGKVTDLTRYTFTTEKK